MGRTLRTRAPRRRSPRRASGWTKAFAPAARACSSSLRRRPCGCRRSRCAAPPTAPVGILSRFASRAARLIMKVGSCSSARLASQGPAPDQLPGRISVRGSRPSRCPWSAELGPSGCHCAPRWRACRRISRAAAPPMRGRGSPALSSRHLQRPPQATLAVLEPEWRALGCEAPNRQWRSIGGRWRRRSGRHSRAAEQRQSRDCQRRRRRHGGRRRRPRPRQIMGTTAAPLPGLTSRRRPQGGGCCPQKRRRRATLRAALSGSPHRQRHR
mmetsp:Transcript_11450/g.33000  ORF Transcript_11450/g.33000 Transcript_11450/m.33000 type:complete len:269 (+) Transcript_11450:921-1727(+)